jgi:hypothetical protein
MPTCKHFGTATLYSLNITSPNENEYKFLGYGRSINTIWSLLDTTNKQLLWSLSIVTDFNSKLEVIMCWIVLVKTTPMKHQGYCCIT